MKLRAWSVASMAILYSVAVIAISVAILKRQLEARFAHTQGDYLTTIEVPGWWWALLLGPPLALIAFYLGQRARHTRAARPAG